MIISHKYKYLFVEVPSTASTAISNELQEFYDGESILPKHANYSQFRALRLPGTYFTFATVRNPLDQAVSYYTRLKRNHKGQYSNPARYRRNGGWIPDEHLEHFEFVQKTQADFPTFFKRYYTRIFHEWVLLRSGEFDLVMRYENIQEDFATVLRSVGVRQQRPIPVLNATGRKDRFADYYPPEIRRDAARYLGPYLERWGYALPPEWGDVKVPRTARLRFAAVETAVGFAARRLPLNASARPLQAARSVLRRLKLA